MNTSQKILVVAGCIAAALNFYFMPVTATDGVVTRSATLHLESDWNPQDSMPVDNPTLLVRLGVVVAVTSVMVFAFREKPEVK